MEKPIDVNTMGMAFVDRPLAKVHKFYLSGEIKAPSEYVGVFETIRNASENDVVVLHINKRLSKIFGARPKKRVRGSRRDEHLRVIREHAPDMKCSKMEIVNGLHS